jgi:precorrin-2 dehydrogenase/sirohydrochlorin ferrochelatase
MEIFPAFFPLAGRRIVIVGDGEGATAKARLFRDSPADVVRLDVTAALEPGAYEGADLIFIASYDRAFVVAAARAARQTAAPLNVVDHPELSDFHTPAIIDRGQVVAAVGTAGAAPLLAALLRAQVETIVRPGAGRVAGLLGEHRSALREAFPDLAARRAFLRTVLAGPVGAAAEAGDMALAAEQLDAAISGVWSTVGGVSFIETPPAPDLVSVRAVRVLNAADVVVGAVGSEAIVDTHARRDAEHWTAEGLSEDALFERVEAGQLVAIVAHEPPESVLRGLEARRVRVERLTPAGAS